MYRFILKNIFTKIYIYYFLINNFIKISSQSYALEIVSLSKTTLFFSTEVVPSLDEYPSASDQLRGALCGEQRGFYPSLACFVVRTATQACIRSLASCMQRSPPYGC